MTPYKRPPIIEAVLEVRLAAPIEEKKAAKVEAQFQKRYPTPPQRVANLSLESDGASLRINQEQTGFKILSADGAFTVTAGRVLIATSRTAPYCGWEQFIAEARVNWADWTKIVGWNDIARIGLRYINRIDIPAADEHTEIKMDDYFRFVVQRPNIPGFGAMNGYAATTEIPMLDQPIKLVLNTSPTVSPLIKTISFLLDLDVSVDDHLPRSEQALWNTVEALRSIKNSVFEACITDKTRVLFL